MPYINAPALIDNPVVAQYGQYGVEYDYSAALSSSFMEARKDGLFHTASRIADHHFGQGDNEVLTREVWDSEYGESGLDYEEGQTRRQWALIKEARVDEIANQTIMSGGANGFWENAGLFGTGMAGGLSDVGNLATIALPVFGMSRLYRSMKNVYDINKARRIQTAAIFGVAAVEGAILEAPIAYQRTLEQADYDVTDFVLATGLNTLLGGGATTLITRGEYRADVESVLAMADEARVRAEAGASDVTPRGSYDNGGNLISISDTVAQDEVNLAGMKREVNIGNEATVYELSADDYQFGEAPFTRKKNQYKMGQVPVVEPEMVTAETLLKSLRDKTITGPEVDEFRRRVTEYDKETAELSRHYKSVDKEVNASKRKLDDLNTRLKARQEDQQKSLNKAKADLETAQVELAETSEKQRKSKIKTVEKNLNERQSLLETSRAKLAEVEEYNSKIDPDAKPKKGEKKKKPKSTKKLKSAIEAHEAAIKSLKDDLSKLSKKADPVDTKRIVDLKAKIEKLESGVTDQVKKVQDDIAEIEAHIEQLNKHLTVTGEQIVSRNVLAEKGPLEVVQIQRKLEDVNSIDVFDAFDNLSDLLGLVVDNVAKYKPTDRLVGILGDIDPDNFREVFEAVARNDANFLADLSEIMSKRMGTDAVHFVSSNGNVVMGTHLTRRLRQNTLKMETYNKGVPGPKTPTETALETPETISREVDEQMEYDMNDPDNVADLEQYQQITSALDSMSDNLVRHMRECRNG